MEMYSKVSGQSMEDRHVLIAVRRVNAAKRGREKNK